MSASSIGACISYPVAPILQRFSGLVQSTCFGYKLGIRSEARMVPFFVQIKCQLGKSYDVASKLADAEIASEIYSTAGEFDLLVKFYVEPSTDIGHFIAQKVQTIPGIADTRTIITFKAFGGS
jgi:DNA-binding Lrp family transcriptional regulator